MKFLPKKHTLILTSFVLIISVVMTCKIALAFHQPDLINFSPTTLGIDDVAGKTDASYDIFYSPLFQNTLDTIVVTFPSGYVITDGTLDPSTAITSSLQDTCTGSAGFICVAGDDTTNSVLSMTGDSTARTITIVIDPVSLGGFNNADFEFTNLQGIQNPTTAGIIAKEDFILSNNADNTGTFIYLNSDVTIIADVATTLDFTTLPSQSPTPPNGDVTSNTTWTTQPVVTAHDQFGNVATSYDGDTVSLTVGSGVGVLAFSGEPTPPCPTISGSYSIAAVAGVADFSGSILTYVASADHEAFTLDVSHACGIHGGSISGITRSSSITADVVADSLQWTQDPVDCTSGIACTTQGTVQAVQLVSSGKGSPVPYLDTDYTSSVNFSVTGLGTLFGTTPQTITSGILNIVGLGYNNSDSSIDETTAWIADDGVLTSAQSSDVIVAAAPATPPPPPSPPAESIGGGYNKNPNEIPGYVAPILSSVTNSQCAPYLTVFLRKGSSGDAVKKLQTFLKKYNFFSYPNITGFFGPITEQAVKTFQSKYTADILMPQDLPAPTGIVLDYTQKKINMISCIK